MRESIDQIRLMLIISDMALVFMLAVSLGVIMEQVFLSVVISGAAME
ncbi:hypothetical protein [Paenibacillus lautus]|nr:hypothetical protein [Paenibacillus lautus]MEC0256827.1 hypothetical protein [Paenibacillus lautus]